MGRNLPGVASAATITRRETLTRGIKLAALTTLWLTPSLLFFFAFRFGWYSVWTAIRVPAAALPFVDLRSITGALVTLQKHGDPLLANPADPWNRPMNYPRVWLYLFSILGINDREVSAVGIVFCALYLGCISALILRCKRALEASILVLTALSWAPLLAIERGNTDLLIFFLVFLGCSIPATSLQLSMFSAATVLKIYPLAAMVINAIRQPIKLRMVSLVLTALVLGSFAWQWRDVKAIRNSTPESSQMAFGVLSIKAQLEDQWGSLNAHRVAAGWTVVLACWLAGAAAIAAAYKSRSQLDEPTLKSSNGKMFSIFGAIYVFSFAIGSNWDYRLIFLLPTLPFVFELASIHAHRRWAIIYLAAVLLAENPLYLRNHGTALSHLTTFGLFLMVLMILTQQCKPHVLGRYMNSN